MNHVFNERRAGVLCHITSLPCGDIGDAERFLDLLVAAGISVWQVLPLNPPDQHHSPYCSSSLFAGNGALLPANLVSNSVDDPFAIAALTQDLQFWLRDFAIFAVAHNHYACSWLEWPAALRDREPRALRRFVREHAAQIAAIEQQQIRFIQVWRQLRAAAQKRGVLLFGDMPLYPAHDSADVWAHRELFQLDNDGAMTFVAGVPPDYFSPTGQLWGNPVYDWNANQRDGFVWWRARIAHAAALFDVVRIDHFRGLDAYWRVPAGAEDASAGVWQTGPGAAFFAAVPVAHRGALVAEDLGDITPAVDALRSTHGLPGMRVLQFGFSGDVMNPHLPEHVSPHCVYYTGTHDNDTTLSWYLKLDANARAAVDAWLAKSPTTSPSAGQEPMPWPLIARALQSAASTAIVPMQDLLSLDGAHRMNVPGAAAGNWTWRFDWEHLPDDLAARLRALVSETGRLPRFDFVRGEPVASRT